MTLRIFLTFHFSLDKKYGPDQILNQACYTPTIGAVSQMLKQFSFLRLAGTAQPSCISPSLRLNPLTYTRLDYISPYYPNKAPLRLLY